MLEAAIDLPGAVSGSHEIAGEPTVPANAEEIGKLLSAPGREAELAQRRRVDESVGGRAQARERQHLVRESQVGLAGDLVEHLVEGLLIGVRMEKSWR